MMGRISITVASLAIACAPVWAQQNPVKIGVLSDMSGPYADLAGKGVSEADVRKKMDELVAVAVSQIKAGQ